MNICLIIGGHYPPFPHGGVGSFAVDLSEGIVKYGHQVTCISFYSSDELNYDHIITEMINGVKIIRVPKPYQQLTKRTRAIFEKFFIAKLVRDLHRTDPFDIIECEDGGGLLALGRLPDIPKIARLHATTIYNDYVLKRKPSRLNHLFEYLWLRRANYLVAVSDYVGRTTLDLTHLADKKKYSVIHLAINTDLIKPDWSIAVEPGLIVFTGVVAPRKGVLELIQAMNIVFARDKNARLWIIGDNEYLVNGFPYARQIIAHLEGEFRERVLFMGNQTRYDLPGFIQKAELCCFPSHVETFGIGIIEAMAMEKPVIYMNTGPGPEIIEDRISGLLCDTWNPSDIADKILCLLTNPKAAQEIGRNARQRVVSKFDLKPWLIKNMDFYNDCIQQYLSAKS
jgi:glycosyltransferase involved in cell wall biosynthesis